MYHYLITIKQKNYNGIETINQYICETWAQVGEYLPKENPNKNVEINIKSILVKESNHINL